MRAFRLRYPMDLKLEGTGWDLELKFTATLERRRAAEERVEIAVKLSRPNIRCLLESIAGMHVRDRERLASEAARIEKEIKSLGG